MFTLLDPDTMVDIITILKNRKYYFDLLTFLFIKVSKSRNKIVMPKLLPKNERTNLFFYPDDSENIFWEKLGLNSFVSRSTDL